MSPSKIVRHINGMRSTWPQVLTAALLVLLAASNASAQAGHGTSNTMRFDPVSITGPDPKKEYQDIQIVQKLEGVVPLDTAFTAEDGSRVTLRELMNGKPVVLALVYYECVQLCNRLLNGLRETLDSEALKLELGKDFQVIAISIDPEETHQLAAEKKANYIEGLGQGAETGWHFLTGTTLQIDDVAQAVGFRYFYDEKSDQFAHSAGVIMLTPDGVVSSYLLGLEFPPSKLETALIVASEGGIGSYVERAIVMLCFAYDPQSGYGFQIILAMRVVGTAVLGALLLFWLVNYVRTRRSVKNATGAQPVA
jgi:protein SCO1/2